MRLFNGQVNMIDLRDDSALNIYGGEVLGNIDVYGCNFILHGGYVKRLDVWNSPTVTLMG